MANENKKEKIKLPVKKFTSTLKDCKVVELSNFKETIISKKIDDSKNEIETVVIEGYFKVEKENKKQNDTEESNFKVEESNFEKQVLEILAKVNQKIENSFNKIQVNIVEVKSDIVEIKRRLTKIENCSAIKNELKKS